MGATKPVTDETFEAEVLQSTRTVLVDYWAERCGPSKMIAPILEAIAEEHGDKFDIAKLNVDENPQVTQKYNILNIPTWRRIRRFRLTGALDGPGPARPNRKASCPCTNWPAPRSWRTGATGRPSARRGATAWWPRRCGGNDGCSACAT
jgi:thioredoxin 1